MVDDQGNKKKKIKKKKIIIFFNIFLTKNKISGISYLTMTSEKYTESTAY